MFEELSAMDHFPSRFFFGWMKSSGLGGNLELENGESLMKNATEIAMKMFQEQENDDFAQFALGFFFFFEKKVIDIY